MSNSSSTSSGSNGASSSSSPGPAPASVTAAPDKKPVTQEKRKNFRKRWPIWMRQLPQMNFPKLNPDFELIKLDDLETLLRDADPQVVQRIEADIKFMEHELMRLFRERDYEAALQQNRYRLYQIAYIFLAIAATLLGSFQGVALNSNPHLMPLLAFGETLVALTATLLATISGREPPFQLWMTNRRRAESLRREYFRFLMNLPPYDQLDGYKRRTTLSERAADINRGVFPSTEEEKGS